MKTPEKKIILILAAGAMAQALESLPQAASLMAPLTRLTAVGTAQFAKLLGMPIFVDGDQLFTLGYGLRIIPSCNNLVGIALVMTAVACLPGPPLRRILRTLAGALFVVTSNCLRVGTVLMIGTRNAEAARSVHEIGFPVLYLMVAMVLMAAWVHAQRQGTSGAPLLVNAQGA